MAIQPVTYFQYAWPTIGSIWWGFIIQLVVDLICCSRLRMWPANRTGGVRALSRPLSASLSCCMRTAWRRVSWRNCRKQMWTFSVINLRRSACCVEKKTKNRLNSEFRKKGYTRKEILAFRYNRIQENDIHVRLAGKLWEIAFAVLRICICMWRAV